MLPVILMLVSAVSAEKAGRMFNFYSFPPGQLSEYQPNYLSAGSPLSRLDLVILPRTGDSILPGNKFYNLLLDFGLAKYFVGKDQSTDIYTIFMPSDEALESMPKEHYQRLSSDPAKMKEFLENHIVKGSYSSLDIPLGQTVLKSVSSHSLFIHKNAREMNRQISVNNADVMMVDSKLDNAIVHLIDAPLYTPKNGTVYDILQSCPQYEGILQMIDDSDLKEDFKSDKGITFFAPIRRAMEAYRSSSSDEDNEEFIKGHLVQGVHYSSSLIDAPYQLSEAKTELIFGFTGEKLKFVNDIKVLRADIVASNGVVHVINSVLDTADLCD